MPSVVDRRRAVEPRSRLYAGAADLWRKLGWGISSLENRPLMPPVICFHHLWRTRSAGNPLHVQHELEVFLLPSRRCAVQGFGHQVGIGHQVAGGVGAIL